ncbi:hypothetical protein V493_01051 [Pseudogymnoascus sp. VKM F-4281 (FW-2241)]|nr:hypothetical protein V493_01051 [Pseudogymnoascus sp. VKM F-4281 (FW-2241)]
MLRLSILATIGLLAAQGAAVSIKRFDSPEPFYDHDTNTPADCTLWWNSDDGLSCDTALLIADVTISQLTSINPSIKSCGDWKEDYSYCIQSASGFPTTTPAPGTTTPPTTTVPPTTTTSLPGNGVATPTPFQVGMTTSCNRFRLVKAGDQCGNIASEAGISLAEFYRWNTGVGSKCGSLWASYYVCIGILGSTPSPTTPGNGVATPSPTQPGMTTDCAKFHLVKSGDQCLTIAAGAGISHNNFYAWNPSVGSSCGTLYAGSYVCVGLVGCKRVSSPGSHCGRVGVPISVSGAGKIATYTAGSPHVASPEACSAKCLSEPACTSFYIVNGSDCTLYYGPVAFSPNGNAGARPYYQQSCFECPSTVRLGNSCPLKSPLPTGPHCGRVGFPISSSSLLTSYTAGSRYVASVEVCAAKCLNTPSCTGIYVKEESVCNLHYGPVAFSPNGNAGALPYYEAAACFDCPSTATCTRGPALPAGHHCGRIGNHVAVGGGGLLQGTSDKKYTSSVGVCAAWCLHQNNCSSFFFKQDSTCNLFFGPISFNPNGLAPNTFYEAACFPSCAIA